MSNVRSPQTVRAQSFQANQQAQEDGTDLAIARSLSNVRSPQTVRAQSFQANQQVQEDGMDLAIARSLSDRQVSQASTQSSAERLREKQAASLTRSNSLREKRELEQAIRLSNAAAAPSVQRVAHRPAGFASEPWYEKQVRTLCGKHSVNTILVALGFCTSSTVPLEAEYEPKENNYVTHSAMHTVLDKYSLRASNNTRPLQMMPLRAEMWTDIANGALPREECLAFVVNTLDPHWYAFISRMEGGRRVWWDVDSLPTQRRRRVGTDADMVARLQEKNPSRNINVKQVLGVTFNPDRLRLIQDAKLNKEYMGVPYPAGYEFLDG